MIGMAARWLARKNPARSWAELERKPFEPSVPTASDLYSRRTLTGLPRPPAPNLKPQAAMLGTRVTVFPARVVTP